MRLLKQALCWLLAIFMILAGIMHFVRPGFYQAMIPPMFPAPLALVYISGVFEIVFGVLLLIPRYRRIGAWGIVATLIAVYPANIYHALAGGLTHPDLPPAMQNAKFAWARLPFQLVFLAWAWWFTRPDHKQGQAL